jgi:D-amino-acid dehydrogenase
MEPDAQVVVVGAGVIGLACAYALAARGIHPLVIDAESRPGAGASWANAGSIAFAPEIVAPVPGPGVPSTALRWLMEPDRPLRVVPHLDREYFRWIRQFVGKCSPEASTAGLLATLALNAATPDLFDQLKGEGLEVELQKPGLLLVHQTRRSFESARAKAEKLNRKGLATGRVLSREEALTAEPLLRPDACFGAFRYEGECQVRPDKLITALASRLTEIGVEIRTGCSCLGFNKSRHAVVGLHTSEGVITGGAFVIAAGVNLSSLVRKAGVKIPIVGGRGYSLDVPRGELPIASQIYLYERRLFLTPFRDFTRISGMMELGARDATVRPGAISAIRRGGAASFRNWPASDSKAAWAGVRPLTPDGLPVIGPIDGVENLYVAGGHGMLGVTLSLRTGKAIAEWIQTGACRDPALRPFSPNRFGRSPVRLGGSSI